MKIGQIVFSAIGLFLACMMLVSVISMFFIVMPEYPDVHGWWKFLMVYEIVLLLTIGGGALANFAKGRLAGWPTAIMIAGYFMSGWLTPLAIWGIVSLIREQRRQLRTETNPETQPLADNRTDQRHSILIASTGFRFFISITECPHCHRRVIPSDSGQINLLQLMSEYIDKFEFIKTYCDASKIDENGELPLTARLDIRHRLPFVKANANSSSALWELLEIKCAEMRSLVWTRSFPQDRTPMELLQKAERTARGGSEKAERAEMDDVKTLLDNKLSLGEQFFPASYAGFACWAAARSVYFGVFDYGPAASEKDLDPEQWDACFFASLAYCGGAVWEEGIGDKTKRREFWKWYLEQAIPNLLPQ